MQPHVYSSTIYTRWDMEPTQMPNSWMDKLWDIYTGEYYCNIRKSEIFPFAKNLPSWKRLFLIKCHSQKGNIMCSLWYVETNAQSTHMYSTRESSMPGNSACMHCESLLLINIYTYTLTLCYYIFYFSCIFHVIIHLYRTKLSL